ncbi:MAG: hypothetical protein PHG48_08695 [Eubacteriales bacterium]|nr:hypothetical protein [Eubacteriales bacterium]
MGTNGGLMFENRWETVVAGIRKHYTDTENIDLDKYIYYGSLCQGLILGYAFESMRFRADCNGAIFWMFSDCWGEVGWTIVDYYLARKPSYYYVKRALAPARLIMREKGGEVTVVMANDKPDTIDLNLEYGYVTFTGVKKDTGCATVCAKPFTRTVAAVFKEGGHDLRKGCYYAKVLSCGSAGKRTEGKRAECGEVALESNQYDIQPAILRSFEFRKLDMPHAELSISGIRQEGDMVSLTVSSNKFAHAVHFVSGRDITPSDDYFDLLPGEERKILITTEKTSLSPDMIRAEYVVPEGKKK